MTRVYLCSLEASDTKGTLGGENQPQCMLGRRGVMTENEFLQGQPADTANCHQQRQLVTSNARHTAMQGQSTQPWHHRCGIQYPGPDSFLKVSTDVGVADENRRSVATKTTSATQNKGGMKT